MMTKEVSTQIVNFMTPRARVLVLGCGHVKCIISIKIFLFTLMHKYKVMITKEGSTQIVNFITLRAGVLM